jgi:hypothetical protein
MRSLLSEVGVDINRVAPRERLDHRRHGSANQSCPPRQDRTRRSPRKGPWARIVPSAAAIEVSDGCQVSGHSRQTVGDLRLTLPCRDIRDALAAGDTDNAAPGVREQHHPTYDGAFVLDPNDHAGRSDARPNVQSLQDRGRADAGL